MLCQPFLSPINFRLIIRMTILPILVFVLMISTQTVMAQPPDEVPPLLKGPVVTAPVTGSAPNMVEIRSNEADPDPSHIDAIPADSNNSIQGEPEVDSYETDPDNGMSPTKAYSKFEVNQRALTDLNGKLKVKGLKAEQTIPYSVTAGDSFSVAVLFSSQTGPYELEMTSENHDSPVLWAEGNLQSIGGGRFVHQYLNGDADPNLLTLEPGEPGITITLGSIRAKLHSCVDLQQPVEAVFNLGADINGDGIIDPSELVTKSLSQESQSCIKTPEANLPLISQYVSSLVTSDGLVIVENQGLYDFLNKSAINTKKETREDLVKEFSVSWSRTPVATSVGIHNKYLRAPAEEIMVLPQLEEITRDIIQNSPHNNIETLETAISPEKTGSMIPEIDHNNVLDFLIDSWFWIALCTGSIIVIYLVYRKVNNS